MGTYRAVKVVYRWTFDHDGPYEREFAGIRKFEPISRSQESQVDILHIGRNDTEKYFYYVMELADAAVPHGEISPNESFAPLTPEPPHPAGGHPLPQRGRGQGEGAFRQSKVHGEEKGLKMEDCSGTKTPASHPPSSILDPQTYTPRTLQHDVETRGRLPFAECLRISVALANALNHLHQNGLVHRDIKPSNIIFVNGIPKLADIGLVTESEATLSYVGAQGFMPPEGPGRPTGDIYSLGKVIYELCTGRDRLDFPALPANFGDWPDREQMLELIAISLKACEPDAARRYASAEELIADLLFVQAGKSLRKLRWLERNRRWATVAVLVMLTIAVFGWFMARMQRAGERGLFIQAAQSLRLGERQAGWSSNTMLLLNKAARTKVDDDLRTQAAANLDGVDAHVITAFCTNGVKFLAFDAQGRRLLMDSEGGRTQLRDLQTGQFTIFNSTNTGPVWFASDGSPRQFICDDSGVCRMLNLERGTTLQEFRFDSRWQTNEVQVLAVSKNGKFCGAGSTNHIAIWEVISGRLITNLLENCSALAFAPDDSSFGSGNEDGNVRVRTLPDLHEVASFHQGNAVVNCLALGRDPTHKDGASDQFRWWLSAGDSGGMVNIFQIADGGLKTVCRGSSYDVYSVAFSPDGMTLASAGRGEMKLWDVATGRNLLNITANDYDYALTFSPDGTKLAVGGEESPNNTYVQVVGLEKGRGVNELLGLSSRVSKVEFSHDGLHLAALAHNWEVGIWNLASNRLERIFEVPKGMFAGNAALVFNLDDSQLAFSTLTETRLWDIKSGRLLGSWHLPSGLVQKLCFCPDGRLLQFQRDWHYNWQEGMCCVRDLTAPNYAEPLHKFPHPSGRVTEAVFSPRGEFLAIIGGEHGSNDVVKVFNPLSGRELASLPDTGHKDGWFVSDPQVTRIGCPVGTNHEVIFYGMPQFRNWRSFRFVVAGALSPDSSLLLNTWDGVGATVFKTENPAWRITLAVDHHTTSNHHSRFSPDGKLAAWGTAEGTVFVCELEKVLDNLKAAGLGLPQD